VPIARTFLSLGMHRGPLLAYLLADPELSLQSILITNTVIGKKKTAAYVVLVTIFSTASGLLFGAWVNGTNAWLIVGLTLAAIAVVALVAILASRRKRERVPLPTEAH